eukprot:8012162-Karenia_brevis.AAC.1
MEETLSCLIPKMTASLVGNLKDERLDIKHLCDAIHDFVEHDSPEDMIISTKWWPVGSCPPPK